MSAFGSDDFDQERFLKHQRRLVQPTANTATDVVRFTSLKKQADAGVLTISETVSPATFDQDYARIAVLGGDKSVVVWQDNRGGAFKIYAQLYTNQGWTSGDNVLMVGRDDGYDVIEPEVVADGSGGFYLAWRDVPSGKIYAARYDASLNEIVSPFVANGTSSTSVAGPYAIDAYAGGTLVVVWEDYDGGNDIGLCLYSPTGTPLLNTVTVNTDGGAVRHWVPSVAIDTSGAMMVVWEDYRHGNADIFMQMVHSDGSLGGDNIGLVEAAVDDSAQYFPKVAYSPRDGYAVAWIDRRDGVRDVFMQRIVPGTGLVGDNVKVSPDNNISQDWDLSMAVNSSGDLKLVWATVNSLDLIFLQNFTAGFALSGVPVRLNDVDDGSRWGSALAIRSDNRLLTAWTDLRDDQQDIYLQYLGSSGSSLYATDMLINDDTEGAHSTEPDIALLDAGNGAAVFTDRRFDDGDIFLQLAEISGNLNGGNIPVNDDETGSLQLEPAVAALTNKIMVVWNDNRAIGGVTGPRIFAQYYGGDRTPVGVNFAVSDSMNVLPKSMPDVALASDGIAMVVWAGYHDGNWHIFGRQFHANGMPMDDVYQISISGTNRANRAPSVHVDDNDYFTVTWLADAMSGATKAQVARYSKAGLFQNRFEFGVNIPGYTMTDLASAVNPAGNIYLLSQETGTQNYLNLVVYSPSGAIVKGAFSIVDQSAMYPAQPAIAVDNEGVALMSWVDSRNGVRAVYYQLIAANFGKIGNNQALVAVAPEAMYSPGVAGMNRNGWFIWSDPSQDGFNIYLSQLQYSTTDADDDIPDLLPDDYLLSQNYPNPFNPSTTIEFSLPARDRVVIAVYDILGRRVTTITDQVYAAGVHRVEWNGRDGSGTDLPSGMYLYRMQTGEKTYSRKMIMLK
ncbi:MAG: T9SS type A sorting domain-containing protein [candidate division Zixibacteria bacterium]|nr:T9SS type A sorting domain-containing protein [candidate division Zixibacteria bacterium]